MPLGTIGKTELLRNLTHSPPFHKKGIDNDIKSAYTVLIE